MRLAFLAPILWRRRRLASMTTGSKHKLLSGPCYPDKEHGEFIIRGPKEHLLLYPEDNHDIGLKSFTLMNRHKAHRKVIHKQGECLPDIRLLLYHSFKLNTYVFN